MITLRPALVAKFMVACAVVLHVTSSVGLVLDHLDILPSSIASLVSIHGETTIPAWYSSITLFACAALLGVIALHKRRAGDRYALHWVVLAATFVLLSLDEAAAIHELSIPVFSDWVGGSRLLSRAWVVPGMAFVAVFGLASIGFLRGLPGKTRRLFMTAGALFVTGAVGFEMIGGLTSGGVAYELCVHAEEGLEMLGIVVFVYALLLYINEHLGDVRFVAPGLRAGEAARLEEGSREPARRAAPPARPRSARVLWGLYALFVVYGTLLPFQPDLRAESALAKLEAVSWTPFVDADGSRASIPDMAQNVLFFVPVGFLGMLAMARRSLPRIALVTLLGLGLSLCVEVLQLFAVGRTPSTTDLATNTIGTFLGATASFVLLRSFASFIGSARFEKYRHDKHFHLLLIGLAVVAAGALQPFSFTLDAGSVLSKLRSLVADPFRVNLPLRDEVITFFRFFLFCTVSGLWFRRIGLESFTARAVAFSVAVGTFFEACQILVSSRMPTAQDVVVIALGSLAGGVFLSRAPWRAPITAWTVPVVLATIVAAAVEAWSPFVLASESARFRWIPFGSLYGHMTFSGLKRVLEALLIYFPVGFILEHIYSRHRSVAYRIAIVSLCAWIASVIELGQGWVVDRVPGMTDVLVAILGALFGIWACARWNEHFAAVDSATSAAVEPKPGETREAREP